MTPQVAGQQVRFLGLGNAALGHAPVRRAVGDAAPSGEVLPDSGRNVAPRLAYVDREAVAVRDLVHAGKRITTATLR